MQTINGNIEVKDSVHFGRPNYLIFERPINATRKDPPNHPSTKQYCFYIDNLRKFCIGETGITSDIPITVNDLDVCNLNVSCVANIQQLNVTGDVCITGTLKVDTIQVDDLDITGTLSVSMLCVTDDAVFKDDVTIMGDLTVLGGITSIFDIGLFTTACLFQLAEGNPADMCDIGIYGQYVSAGTTFFTGLFRNASDTGKKWVLFDGTTEHPTQTIPEEVPDDLLADIRLGTICSQNIVNEFNITSNDIGTTSLGVTGTATINILDIGISMSSPFISVTTLLATQIGVTNLGVSGILDVECLLADKIGVTGDLSVTGNTTFEGTFDVMGDSTFINLIATDITVNNNINIGGDTIVGGNLCVTGDVKISGDLSVTGDTTLDGDLLVGTTLFFIDTVNNFVGICTTTPNFKLDVVGDLNVTGAYFQNGITVMFGGQWADNGTGDIYNINLQNVGIGITNPSFPLDVSGDANISGKLYVGALCVTGDTDLTGMLTVTGDSTFFGETFFLNNVGICTTTPSFKLDVSGDINTSTTIRIDGIDIETVFNIIQVENKKTYFNEFLSLDDAINVNGNYSSGVTEFTFTNASSTETVFVSNMVVKIRDDGSFNMNQYASLGTTLANGINVYYTGTSGTVRNNIIGTTYNIQKNADYNNYTNDVVLTDLGTGDTVYTITLDFRNNGSFIILREADKFAFEVNDDLTLVNEQNVQINGFLYSNSEL